MTITGTDTAPDAAVMATEQKSRVVVIYSGGMDSFTLVSRLRYAGYLVYALSFDYGQRHAKELKFAHDWAEHIGVTHRIVDMTSIGQLITNSALTKGGDVPEGHYSEENMKQTVVPNRNMIMLSVAIGYAVNIGAGEVYTAVHAGDHAIYPDCREVFINAVSAVGVIANYQSVLVKAPYIDLDKHTILRDGAFIGLEAKHYANAWTCYNGRDKACGKCGACVERLEAFHAMGWEDPLEYEDKEFWKEAVANAK